MLELVNPIKTPTGVNPVGVFCMYVMGGRYLIIPY